MNKKLIAAMVLASPIVAHAEVGGFIDGGVTAVTAEAEVAPVNVKMDTGVGFTLDGGVRWSPGLMVKGSFAYSTHSGGDAYINGAFAGSFTDTVNLSELRLGLYSAPPIEQSIGFRLGGGYMATSVDVGNLGTTDSDGFYCEAALLIKAGPRVTLDLGAAAMSIESDTGTNMDGGEARVGAKIELGAVDLGVGYRYMSLSGGGEKDQFGEFRVTVGGKWGYPTRR